uniref:Genome polyprotein n=1 Tax=Duck sapelovirus TaxID=3163392 RepID=A0AAU7PJ66_9PICO
MDHDWVIACRLAQFTWYSQLILIWKMASSTSFSCHKNNVTKNECTSFHAPVEMMPRCMQHHAINHYYCARHYGKRSEVCCACECIMSGKDVTWAFVKKQLRAEFYKSYCSEKMKKVPEEVQFQDRLPDCDITDCLHRVCDHHEGRARIGDLKTCCFCSRYGEFCDPYEWMVANRRYEWVACNGRQFPVTPHPACIPDGKVHMRCPLHAGRKSACCTCEHLKVESAVRKTQTAGVKCARKQGLNSPGSNRPVNVCVGKSHCDEMKYISYQEIRLHCCDTGDHGICAKHWNNTICCRCLKHLNSSEPGHCCPHHEMTRAERRLLIFRTPCRKQDLLRTKQEEQCYDVPDTLKEETMKYRQALDFPCYFTGRRHSCGPQMMCWHPKGSGRLHWYCSGHYDERPRRYACCACWSDDANEKKDIARQRWLAFKQCKLEERRATMQGQVQSNQTGNSPNITSATATGGSHITTVNYYGAQYAQAYNPSSQSMDPAQFTEPMASLTSAATGIPMLQNPSAEECGYSDRVMQLTSGNSTLITQEAAAGALIAYGRWPGDTDYSGAAVDLPTRPGPSCDRWYTEDTFYWTKTGISVTAGQASNGHIVCGGLPGVLIKQGVFGQNCVYHYLWRGGFAVHVQCNASKFHQGMLMVVAIPELEMKQMEPDFFYAWTSYTSNPGVVDQAFVPTQLNVFPHQYINLRTNNSATVVLPYVNLCPQSCPVIHSPWVLCVAVIVPLNYSQGATTEVPITVSICPIDSQFGGLRNPTVFTQGVPTFQVPGSQQFMTTLRNDGFPVMPDFEKTHSYNLPGRVRNLLEVAQIPTLMTGLKSGSEVFHRPWLIEVPDSMNSGEKIFQMDMSLMSVNFESTYLGQLARMYAQYRGDVLITLMFCGTAMTTGKVLVAYTPPGAEAPATRTEAMLGTHVVWDIGLQSSVTMAVPFISTVQARYTSEEDSTLSYCGYITAWLQTKFVHPAGVPSPSTLVAFAAASNNFTFKCPVDNAYFQGLGDQITGQVEGLVNSIGGALQLPAVNSGVPMVQAPPASSNTGLQITEGGSGNLTAMETGVAQTSAAEVQMATRVTTAQFSAQDTDVEFFFSRYMLIGSIGSRSESPNFAKFDLSFEALKSASNAIRTKFQMFTYMRFDIDVVMEPLEEDIPYQVMYCPTGSVVPVNMTQNWNTTCNAVITQRAGKNVCFRVPFTSPGNFFATSYNGYNSFSLGDTYGNPPNGKLGTVCVRKLKESTQTMSFLVYCRPVNIEVYCPRPIASYRTQVAVTRSQFRIVSVPDGDPTADRQHTPISAERQGPVTFQGLGDWLKNLVSSGGEAFSDGLTRGITSALDDYNARSGEVTPRTAKWVKTVLKWLTRVISSMVIAVRSNGDPGIMAALGVSLGIDILTADPFDYVKQMVLANFGWAHKQGPSDWLKDFNAAINAAKGLDWIATRIQEFIKWLSGVEDEVKEKSEKLESVLSAIPSYISEWDDYEKARFKYRESSVIELAEKILESKKVLLEMQKTDNRIYLTLVKYADKASKFIQNSRKRPFEPIGMLVHGKPGCGKSLLTSILGRQLCKMSGKGEPYSIPPDPDHFDGYTGQEVVIMDDLGQNPDGKDCALLCQMISTTEFIPPMASLEEKGIPFTSKFVLASTNLESLAPITVTEPSAIQRRFQLDLEMTVCDDHKTPSGHLDVAKAMKRCEDHDAMHFKFCTPFICGKACKIYNRRERKFTTPDLLVGKLTGLRREKINTSDMVDALFQGPKKIVGVKPVLKFMDDETSEVPTKLMPECIEDLLRSVHDQRIVDWCEEQGYIFEPQMQNFILERESKWMRTAIKTTLTSLAVLGGVCGLIYAAWRLWPTSEQGAYTGNQRAVLKRPELRTVQVQGPGAHPDLQYIQALLNNNIFPIETGSGPYTALGIYERWFVLPKHAVVEPMMVAGKQIECDDIVDLRSNGKELELVALHCPTLNEFRDIRKHLPESIHGEDGCYLVMNSSVYPRMNIAVGRVSVFGLLNLDMQMTYNTLTYAYPTKTGQCGGVVCKAGQILGIHIGGDGSNGYAASLKRSYFTALQGQIVAERPARKSVNVRSTTSLQPSVWHDIVPGEKEPAVLSKFDKRCEVDFELALFSKYEQNVVVPENENVRTATLHYLEQIRPLMPANVTEPLPLEDVVYGTEGLEALDLNTSAGYPYCTMGISKKSLIPQRGEPLTRLQEALDLHGTRLPFVTFLKDELRPKDKIRVGKTRLIEASSLNDTIHMKTHLGRLFAVFNQNPGTVTGSAVGCNPDTDWSKFVNMIGHDNICCFDYKNFDASLGSVWFGEVKFLLRGLGFDPKITDPMIDHICSSTHIYRNKEYDVEGGMPSGCSGTSIFNSIINNIIVRTLVLDTYKGIDLDQLRILAYGDDLLVRYPFPLDPEALARAGRVYGLKMTPADKSEHFDGPKKIWEVTFLKRGFKPDSRYPFLIHPVYPMDQVYESLRWTRKPSETQQHVRSLCELAWHNGEEEYEKFLSIVRSTPVGRALTLPAYQVMCQKWYDSF